MSLFGLFHRKEARVVTIRVSVYVEAEDNGAGYHAFNPAFPGLHVDGTTEDEAVNNFAAAVPAYLESLVRHGDPLPVGCMISQQECQHDAEIPLGAFMQHQVNLKWRSPETSGIS
jgi:predicted RNase H-like HicB family nuclease